MAPRRPHRLTLRKKRKTAVSKLRDPSIPSDEELAVMEQYNTFVVQDADDNDYHFTAGDDILVLPPDMKPYSGADVCDFWVGKILEIRCADDVRHEVWVKVQWYFSPKEAADVAKFFNPDFCGPYERLRSKRTDWIYYDTVDGRATVKAFDPNDVDQEDIGPEDFYTRYSLSKDLSSVTPNQTDQACELCSIPYSPDDDSTIMHFCPRLGCRKGYHDTCLKEHSFTESATPTRPLRLLLSSPDNDQEFAITGTSSPSRKAKKANVRTPVTRDMLADIPSELVKAAQQPIIKGAKCLDSGVAGNIKHVIAARRLVYQFLEGKGPEDWADQVNVSKALARVAGRKSFPSLICPRCRGPI